MLKRLIIAGIGCAAAGAAAAYDLNFRGTDYGTFAARLLAMTIVSARENGWGPTSGNSYSVMGKYRSPGWRGFKLTTAAYLNGDIFNTTDFDPKPFAGRAARGMFIADEGAQKGQLTTVNITYGSKQIYTFGGRAPIDTPLTRNTYNHVPSAYTALRVGAKPLEALDISLGQITQMSFGSRAMADYGFIGEGTGTGGAAQLPNQDGLGQAKFFNLGRIALGPDAENIDGLTLASVTYSALPYATLGVWNAYVDDIANDLYVDVDAKVPLKGLELDLGAQYLRQDKVGDGTAGIQGIPAIQLNFGSGDLNYSLFGLKAGLLGAGQKWALHAMWNHSDGDTGFFNAFGADPAYTSSIFSRNAYRKNVDAWGVRGKYMIIPGVVLTAAYFDYGESDSIGAVPNVSAAAWPTSNAQELDLVLVWRPKPVKGLTLKTFYVNRTSEYDDYVDPVSGRAADATMSHWRLIASYQF
jgi:hypothetical protein